MAHAVIIAGTGRYDDPWHDFPATSYQIAAVLQDSGISCEVRGTKPTTFRALADADLVVVNSGKGWNVDLDSADQRWTDAHKVLIEYIQAGRPLIGVHTACNTFHDVPGWYERLGVRWTADSMHPPISQARVEITVPEHPIVDGLEAFEVFDERYSYLQADNDRQVLVSQQHDDRPHPLVVVSDDPDRRTVYDALGHGVESYESPERRRLLAREAAWALGLDDPKVRAL